MTNKATQRADGRIEVVTVNATGTTTRTVIAVGPIAGGLLVAQLNEAFGAQGDEALAEVGALVALPRPLGTIW